MHKYRPYLREGALAGRLSLIFTDRVTCHAER